MLGIPETLLQFVRELHQRCRCGCKALENETTLCVRFSKFYATIIDVPRVPRALDESSNVVRGEDPRSQYGLTMSLTKNFPQAFQECQVHSPAFAGPVRMVDEVSKANK